MSTERAEDTSRLRFLWLRTLVGPGICIAGLELAPNYYRLGILVVYAGFAIILLEMVCEPSLLIRDYRIQIVLIGLLVTIVDVFTIHVVLSKYSFDVFASVQRDYSPGITLDGVAWQPEFTEVKVILWNASDTDYENLDAFIELDGTAIRGVLIDGSSGECHIAAPDISNGAAYIGHGYSAGFGFAVGGLTQKLQILSSDIYRIQCRVVSSHSSIGISFIEVGMNGQTDDFAKIEGIVIERGRIIGMGPVKAYLRFEPKRLWLHGTFSAWLKKIDCNQLVTLKQ